MDVDKYYNERRSSTNRLNSPLLPKNITASATPFADGVALCVQVGTAGSITLTNLAGASVTTQLPAGGRIEGPFLSMPATDCTGVVGYF